jgi:hypothetical protein
MVILKIVIFIVKTIKVFKDMFILELKIIVFIALEVEKILIWIILIIIIKELKQYIVYDLK